MTSSSSHHLRRLVAAAGILVALCLLLVLLAYLFTSVPILGARAVDLARGVLGDRVISQVEDWVLTAQDQLRQEQYHHQHATPQSPWQGTPFPTPTPLPSPTPSLPPVTITRLPSQSTTPTPSPTLASWELADLPSLGKTPTEGIWEIFLVDNNGKVVAYRTFLQPDPQRPYASVALVAFHLPEVRLHYVPGYEEPQSTHYISRPARIPVDVLHSGTVLAAFNGGFKAEHGHFGVMLDGVTLLPPRDGLGTLAIYKDGRVRLGAWGTEITASPDLEAWRQNGPLIIQAGTINPHTYVTDPQVWGYTTDGSVATGRSAVGLSRDGEVLYYAVGFHLVLPSLARALKDAGAWQAMQLDINNFYTHFESFQLKQDGSLVAVPLLPEMQGPGDKRYLTINARDFFYVTTRP